jgi:Protein of unknown function (DUF3485)
MNPSAASFMKLLGVVLRVRFGAPTWRSLIVIALTGLTVAACLWAVPPPSRSETGIEMNLPSSVDKFLGLDQEISESERVILPPDTEFAKKLYTDGRGDRISCQIVLAGGEKRSIHRPEVCLPAQGWTLRTGEVVPIKLANGESMDVMKLIISKKIVPADGRPRELNSVFIYWFVGKETTTPHHFERILITNLDMLLHNTNHRWAYVIVSAPILEGFVPKGKNTEQTLEVLKEFIATLAPQIIKPRATLVSER